ncbi:hypothetical protein EVAR_16987_1 [Eumeta japonica]|uniref:Uncharacterized protein n=1 Tax=Eumeta variegata TaxID=151549 RepID=A0A4C1TVH5_EUMVA|nr:hypothetical protein EVAR_16987_1 [Eumeta japonica]
MISVNETRKASCVDVKRTRVLIAHPFNAIGSIAEANGPSFASRATRKDTHSMLQGVDLYLVYEVVCAHSHADSVRAGEGVRLKQGADHNARWWRVSIRLRGIDEACEVSRSQLPSLPWH